jgi:hypothetical protein
MHTSAFYMIPRAIARTNVKEVLNSPMLSTVLPIELAKDMYCLPSNVIRAVMIESTKLPKCTTIRLRGTVGA